MLVGIVTVLYNSAKVLDDYFLSLANQTYKNFILYVIDNASSDNSIDIVKNVSQITSFPVRIICNKNNLGVAKGNNQGIEMAMKEGCDYILLSNNDIVLESECIRVLLVVVPKIFFYNSDLLWYAGGGFIDTKGAVSHWGYLERDSLKYSCDIDVDYAPTCVALIATSVFLEIGMFDEKYFVYYDDTDFMRRLKINKINVHFCPQAILWHKESMSTGGMKSDFSVYYMSRNQIYYSFKYFNKITLLIMLLYLFCHYIGKKIWSYSYEQQKILMKGYQDGYTLYRSTLNA